jgi:hypothetical protein
VIDIAAHQRGQRDFLAEPGQPAQIPAGAGEGALRILSRCAGDRQRVELKLELTA